MVGGLKAEKNQRRDRIDENVGAGCVRREKMAFIANITRSDRFSAWALAYPAKS